MGITISAKGSYAKTEAFLRRSSRGEAFKVLNKYGEVGVRALASATPVDTRLSADSWSYQVTNKGGRYTIAWYNSNTVNGTPVVILLQYGHGTGTGGWVAGRDFINPAIRPIFDKIAADVWKEVNK